jgi:hypothetical protein
MSRTFGIVPGKHSTRTDAANPRRRLRAHCQALPFTNLEEVRLRFLRASGPSNQSVSAMRDAVICTCLEPRLERVPDHID